MDEKQLVTKRLLRGIFLGTLLAGSPLLAQSDAGSGATSAMPQLSDQAKAVLGKAQALYYVPAEHGLRKFSCTVEPDWKKFTNDMMHVEDQIKDSPERADAIRAKVKDLSETRYAVVMDETGSVTVTAFRASGGELNPEFEAIVGSLQNMIKGFMQSWVPWALQNPIPNQSASITFSEQGDRYHLLVVPACARPEIHTCAASTQTEIALDKDYLIVEEWNNTPGLKTKILPKFTKTAGGLFLTGADTEMNRGQVKTSFEVEYQDVSGLKLPAKAVDKGIIQGDPSQPPAVSVLEMAFTNYKVN